MPRQRPDVSLHEENPKRPRRAQGIRRGFPAKTTKRLPKPEAQRDKEESP